MRDFRTLQVWSKSHALALQVYRLTREFPSSEKFGLIPQMRRAAVSIGANIAEGCGRGSDPELARFLRIAMGSACELENHLLLSEDLELVTHVESANLLAKTCEVKRMLGGLLKRAANS